MDDVKSVNENEEDTKEAGSALKENAKDLKDSDLVVVKIDDRTFNTTRGTLTQVKGSFIAKLFGAHHDMMNCNADTFAQVLDVLRYRGAVPRDFKMTHSLYS